MMIPQFGAGYSRTAAAAQLVSPSASFAGRAGEEILAMARAYAGDGSAFLARGDSVNAAASWSYGLGWLDAGEAVGLVTHPLLRLPRLEEADDRMQERLREKTERYRTLLGRALTSLEIAPDSGSQFFRAAEYVLAKSRDAYACGGVEGDERDALNALQQYSYGFGWLDAGIRCGLFRIRAHREIFTV
jgi:hypothetical protein